MLQSTEVVTIPRCVYHGFNTTRPVYFNLVGFCDASSKAYDAVVYARMQDDSRFIVEFLSAKTKVTPISGSSIPCLELFIGQAIMTNIRSALSQQVLFGDPVCYSDSRVALYWIYGCEQEWKQFVENRTNSIHSLIPPHHWRHCAGVENPANLYLQEREFCITYRHSFVVAWPRLATLTRLASTFTEPEHHSDSCTRWM